MRAEVFDKGINTDLILRLCIQGYALAAPSALIVSAHPDDEIIGAGGRLRFLKNSAFIQVTDGAPKNMGDAAANGFRSRKGYAQARRRELLSALGLAYIRPEQCFRFGVIDQEASYNLPKLASTIAEIIKTRRPEMVLTHPYEGGHPDHDAVAFGTHAACVLLKAEGTAPPSIIEFSSYHAKNGKFSVYDFIPCRESEPITVVLSSEERRVKKKMLECFSTQQKTLSLFPVEIERFRVAPHYDFTAPPHAGTLHYENYDFGMGGQRWRELATNALQGLGLKGKI